jgi:CubicO group peptidase (beta-lactamase class C family)
MHDELAARINRAITEKVFPGCVLGIITHSSLEIFTYGNHTYEEGSEMMKEKSIFDIASITKSIPGSVSLLKLIDEKKLSVEDKLIDLVPEFNTHINKGEVKIEHILQYTLDLDVPSLSDLKHKTPDELYSFILRAPLKSPPGSVYKYVNTTAFFISLIVKRITGKELDVYAQEEFFDPLEMKHTTFYPKQFNKEEIVPTEIDEWRGRLIHGEVHDESTYVLRKKYMMTIAGLFSTVPDLLIFQQMLMKKGEWKGKRYFSEEIIEKMNEGWGWEKIPHGFGKTGFTGCLMLTNLEKKVGFTLLSNRTFPKRPPHKDAIRELNKDLSDIIFG